MARAKKFTDPSRWQPPARANGEGRPGGGSDPLAVACRDAHADGPENGPAVELVLALYDETARAVLVGGLFGSARWLARRRISIERLGGYSFGSPLVRVTLPRRLAEGTGLLAQDISHELKEDV